MKKLIKKINKAYEILSNPEKRKNYDSFLKNNEISNEEYNKLYNENIILKNEINYLKNNYNQIQNNYNHFYNNSAKNTEKNITTAMSKRISFDSFFLIIIIFTPRNSMIILRIK